MKSVPYITQHDVDAVINKKSVKIETYNSRRKLIEIRLLIHTDKYPPDDILTESKDNFIGKALVLTQDSDFVKVYITRYPSHKVINV